MRFRIFKSCNLLRLVIPLRRNSICGTLGISLVLGILSACSTMSHSDCLYSDWEVKGEMDGQNGLPVDQFQKYKEDCFKHSVMLSNSDLGDYQLGLDRGYQRFCVRGNAYLHGFRGKTNHDVCPASSRLIFNSGYNAGLEMRKVHSNLRNVTSRIRSARLSIQRLQDDIKEANKIAYDDDATEEDRNRQSAKITEYQARINDLLVELQPLYSQQATVQNECYLVSKNHRDAGYPVPDVCT